ncbi:type 2 isopentenyl-diphosphate Delta-isomerase [Nocardia seriolae]|uniref:Isopentenyl-diphosphate delta-isomerase n=1 Tax=Nocardia seriolae TaxID=37332 RepID=A0ABC8B3U1_9NOCA|nr:type 2 isopentenyl-diphosphate Delta-isomerase [Nocardia seriolae]APB01126.1 Isopentenyl-diphosphate Delta-isomerase [Nocardia seriolae]OJF82359.1 type 2 isopentenyl-diphosphate Delta-isomerase [Nocardia seriolae]PSK26874.1 type 2 isopentenyl-diphosphate Delta-isomerase [Nocardia seriolae]QOW33107.1 type 2 isopentenyl-diphosphate Delta-isomerase [Nocardia seriolae]QUN14654.1 type 2 isopentenyl-diphosphate Delta-isomerase [Nocardia seriolae]
MSGNRKDDHLRLAVEQWLAPVARNEFDDVRFVHHALAGIDRDEVDLGTTVAGLPWPVPLFINAMTGGSSRAGEVNRDLAIAARETGVPVATGSLSAYLRDASTARTYRVMRERNPDGCILANINATASVDDARRAVDLLQANVLQIHLNSIQEIVMPEGERSFRSWVPQLERITLGVGVPVIVKEVGFGLSRETIALLRDIGVAAADVSGRGGTNFALIENARRSGRDYAYLTHWGQSAPASLLEGGGLGLPLLASGGVRHPLDVARALALGATAVGASGQFLGVLTKGGVDALIDQIKSWLDQLTSLMTVLGATTPAALAGCDVVIGGELWDFCALRSAAVAGE